MPFTNPNRCERCGKWNPVGQSSIPVCNQCVKALDVKHPGVSWIVALRQERKETS